MVTKTDLTLCQTLQKILHKGEIDMLANISVAKYLYQIFTDERMEHKKVRLFKECENMRIILLWKIFFETDIRELEVLRERIYKYGSMLKEHDYIGRELFLFLVAMLNLVGK